MNQKHRIWRFIYKLHRYIGLFSAIVLIMLAVTGIALNHTDSLKLDSRMIQSRTILDWYGIASTQTVTSYATANHILSRAGQQVYFDQNSLAAREYNLLGAVETEQFIVAAMRNSLVLITTEGEIIEQPPMKAIEKIGLGDQQQIVIKSEQGLMASNDGLLSWQPYQNPAVQWSVATQAPDSIIENLRNQSRTSILPLERVLLDLHSGRIFGAIGVFIVDLVGLFLIILSLSGCAIWFKHKLRSFRSFLKS